MKRKHTKTNENIIFSVLFTNFVRRKFLFSCRLKQAEKHLNDTNIYKDICFNKKLLQEIVAACDKLFQNLKAKGKISNKHLKDFAYQYKKVTNLGKFYLLPKIHERLANVP